jgi:NADPH-dependent glutamate synthase beta subunit-like oxidoreductase
LVVWAIQEGRAVAQSVDDYLKGLTHVNAVA